MLQPAPEERVPEPALLAIGTALVRLEAFTRTEGYDELASLIDQAAEQADRMLTAD